MAGLSTGAYRARERGPRPPPTPPGPPPTARPPPPPPAPGAPPPPPAADPLEEVVPFAEQLAALRVQE